MRICSFKKGIAEFLNIGKFKCDIVMCPDVYINLISNCFKPKEFITKNEVKIFIELTDVDDVNNISSNIQRSQPLLLTVPEDHWNELLKEINTPTPLRTQSELDNDRLTEIVDAIGRYRKAEMAVPTEWIEEYNTIIERIKNNPK